MQERSKLLIEIRRAARIFSSENYTIESFIKERCFKSLFRTAAMEMTYTGG
jgi:hypothetical protein